MSRNFPDRKERTTLETNRVKEMIKGFFEEGSDPKGKGKPGTKPGSCLTHSICAIRFNPYDRKVNIITTIFLNGD